MSIDVTESPTYARTIEFRTEDGAGADSKVLREAADWLDAGNAAAGNIYDVWIVEGLSISAPQGVLTLQLFILPVAQGQSTHDAEG